MALRSLVFAAALFSATSASAELDLSRAGISHLPNGLTVIMLEDHSFPLVSVQALYKSGSAAEISGKTGLAHFLEHLAFRGSRDFPRERATELIYDAGGEWHGYTAMDQTTYFATMPKDGLDLLLRIEADRMANVGIDAASVEIEKGAVITELHSYENDPASMLQDAVTRTAIQAHPYGSPMAGYVDDVERLTAGDARDYYASHYAPGNAVLAVVGDFDPARARSMIAQAFAAVRARAVAVPNFSAEPSQRGERRTLMKGDIDRQLFLVAYPAPAASSPDFAPFFVLQQMLSGGPGLNMNQDGWSISDAAPGSILAGLTPDVGTWLPVTRAPFLFEIGGSIDAKADPSALERGLGQRLASLDRPAFVQARMGTARAAALRALSGDVQTTEDAAHQLAFFEGVGALDQLLALPALVAKVSAADIARVARTYLVADKRTFGWMVPGTASESRLGDGNPRNSADRAGAPPVTGPAEPAQLRRLSGGLPAIVQPSPVSDMATIELMLSGPVSGGEEPTDLPGLGTVVRTGPSTDVPRLLSDAAAAVRARAAAPGPKSDDPATRLQQLIDERIGAHASARPEPLAVIVAGNVSPDAAFAALERQFGAIAPATLPAIASTSRSASHPLSFVREKIAKRMSQGGIGYVVEGPALGTREALAWQLLLYVFTHDYSGRLGRSAIMDKGLVYHIYSTVRTDGRRTWATISTGVDPNKADATEAELRAQLARLVSEPPSDSELGAARRHLLGRDISAAQSNAEWTSKLAREFIESGGLRSHQRLRSELESITPADLAAATRDFMRGTILRVDVLSPTP